MKHFILIFISLNFLLAHMVQDTVFHKYITVKQDSTFLINLISELQKKSDLQFVYNTEKISGFSVFANYDSIRIDSLLMDIDTQLPSLSIDSYDNIVVLKKIASPILIRNKKPITLSGSIILVDKKQILQIKKDTVISESKEIYVESKSIFTNKTYIKRAISNNGLIKFSVIPSISKSFGVASDNSFSLNLFLGETNRLNGLELSSISSVLYEVSSGVSLSGISNTFYKNFMGVQVGGLTSLSHSGIHGIQFSGLYNSVFNISGLQASIINNAYSVSGIQAGAININNTTNHGGQIGYLFNYSKDNYGFQLAPINVAKNVKNIQIGLINIADKNSGVAIGLLNFIKDGERSISFSKNELQFQQLTFRHGAKYFYNVYDIAIKYKGSNFYWMPSVGLGTSYRYQDLKINGELMVSHLSKNKFWSLRNTIIRPQLTLSKDIYKSISVFAGVSYNAYISRNPSSQDGILKGTPRIADDSAHYVRRWVGWSFGVRLF